jgi:hypothetical protein
MEAYIERAVRPGVGFPRTEVQFHSKGRSPSVCKVTSACDKPTFEDIDF